MLAKQIQLASRPTGWATTDNFQLAEVDLPDPASGQILCEVLCLSVDPYMRGRMNDAKSYIEPFQIGEAAQAGLVARVVASNDGKFKEGALITGVGDWATHFLHSGEGFNEVQEIPGLPLSYYLGVLGMPGMTAYVGLKAVAQLKEGEQLFVSAASGAVGQVVGQIGKNMGCHVAGTAGSDDKVAYLTDTLGFDAAFNYKTCGSVHKAVAAANPKGIDVYFENVGGVMLEAAIANINFNARIALCGLISAYNATLDDLPAGPRNLAMLVGRSVRMQGFIVFNYPEIAREWIGVASDWLKNDKLVYRESVAEGIENSPAAFIDMLKGKNFGKQVIKLAD